MENTESNKHTGTKTSLNYTIYEGKKVRSKEIAACCRQVKSLQTSLSYFVVNRVCWPDRGQCSRATDYTVSAGRVPLFIQLTFIDGHNTKQVHK